MHLSSVLLPEPLGPIRPWSCPSSTPKSTSLSAVSWPKALVTPVASSSAIVGLLWDPPRAAGGDAEDADTRPPGDQQADETARPEEDDHEQEHAEDDGPDRRVRVGEDEADDLDCDDADDGPDQRADATEERIEDDLCRQDHAEQVGPHEALVESIEPAREAGDGAGHREDDGLQRLNAVPEERHARLVDANAGECQPELRADEISTGGIDRDQGGQRQIIVGHALGELRSEEHTSELQSHSDLVCRLLLEKKKKTRIMSCE